MNLIPFVRYEQYDTQAAVPVGYERNPENDVKELTLGVAFQPIPQLILKADWQQRHNAAQDRDQRVATPRWDTFSEHASDSSRPPRSLPSARRRGARREGLPDAGGGAQARLSRRDGRAQDRVPDGRAAEGSAEALGRRGAALGARDATTSRTKDGHAVGTAYFDTHVVRTMPETIMVVVDPAGAIARIEVLSFSEPEEYLPRRPLVRAVPGQAPRRASSR